MKKNRASLVIGRKILLETIREGKSFEKVFLQQGSGDQSVKDIARECLDLDIPLVKVPKVKLDRMTHSNHQGAIGMLSQLQYQNIEQVVPHLYENGKTPLILLLDGITDTRNFGGIARSAEVLGAHAIVVPVKNSAQANTDSIKTSAGALLRLPVCRTANWKETLNYLRMNGIQIVAADEKAEHAIDEIDWTGPVALILGAEGAGLSKDSLRTADRLIKIVQSGKTDSLNVSVACGVILYEAGRQRKQMEKP